MSARGSPLTLGLFLFALTWSTFSRAESILKSDSEHPNYSLELEPHLAVGFSVPGESGGSSLGAGLRLSIPVAKRGLIDGVNDSVAVSFGFDLMRYSGGGSLAGPCADYRGTGSERVCVRVEGASGPAFYAIFPVAFQWNFFLDPEWSVFGEPGLGLYFEQRELDGSSGFGLLPTFQIGGRYHFANSVFLTMRMGYPYFSLGASFVF